MADDESTPKPHNGRAKPGQWGNAPHVVTDENRQKVMAYVAVGLSVYQIAELLHVGESTVERHYKEELANGRDLANARVAATLFNKAMRGDTVAMLFWLKCRAGWVEPKAPQPIVGGEADAPPIRAEHSLKIEFVTPPGLPAPKP